MPKFYYNRPRPIYSCFALSPESDNETLGLERYEGSGLAKKPLRIFTYGQQEPVPGVRGLVAGPVHTSLCRDEERRTLHVNYDNSYRHDAWRATLSLLPDPILRDFLAQTTVTWVVGDRPQQMIPLASLDHWMPLVGNVPVRQHFHAEIEFHDERTLRALQKKLADEHRMLLVWLHLNGNHRESDA